MKKDIEFLKVQNIAIAIVPELADNGLELYTAYLLNLKKTSLTGVFVRVKGTGKIEEREVETATLRILFEDIAPQTYMKIDDFEAAATSLSNEYWISFRENGYMYDKKYVFVPESIVESNFTDIPLIGKKGVLIR